jgi:hypothetical protein
MRHLRFLAMFIFAGLSRINGRGTDLDEKKSPERNAQLLMKVFHSSYHGLWSTTGALLG